MTQEKWLSTRHTLSKNTVKTFLSLLKNADFWNLAAKDDTQGLDGAQWIIEGVKNGKYHIVDRWRPEKGPFREAALFLVKHSKLKIDRAY